MKKVTDLGEEDVIHCHTLKQSKDICKLLHEAGLKWEDGYSYLEENHYDRYRKETCYRPFTGTFSDIEFYQSKGYTIHPASDFLPTDEAAENKQLAFAEWCFVEKWNYNEVKKTWWKLGTEEQPTTEQLFEIYQNTQK